MMKPDKPTLKQRLVSTFKRKFGRSNRNRSQSKTTSTDPTSNVSRTSVGSFFQHHQLLRPVSSAPSYPVPGLTPPISPITSTRGNSVNVRSTEQKSDPGPILNQRCMHKPCSTSEYVPIKCNLCLEVNEPNQSTSFERTKLILDY